MRHVMLAAMLIALGLGGCAGGGYISPNDPQYARSGAPRAGEAEPSPGNLYNRIQGPDGQGGRR